MLAYLNGQYIPRSSATISVEDRGFVFGDGVYEVWRVVNGRLFESERHLDRLAYGLRELRIQPPDVARIVAECAERLLLESGLGEGEATFYMEITRGAAPRTHQFPTSPTEPTVYATVNRFVPADELRARGAACITMPDIRWLRCDIKSIQLLPNVFAKQAAAERGALDTILIRDGNVTESSHANVMAVVDGVIRTHPTNNLVLPGITRAVVIGIARSLGMTVDEKAVTDVELEQADEVFLVGTTTDVMPIVRVNDRPVGEGSPGPITTRLVREFRAYLDAACGAAPASR